MRLERGSLVRECRSAQVIIVSGRGGIGLVYLLG